MVANGEQESDMSQDAPKLREYRIQIASIQEQRSSKRRLLDFLKAKPSMGDFMSKLKFASPLKIFRRTVNQREEISISVPSPVGVGRPRRRFHVQFFRKINWHSLLSTCVEWIKNPMNIALLIWLLCVAVSAAMLGLLLLGLLNDVFPTKALRNYWIEINNQVLNALFTLMSLYQHPNLFYHLAMLCRWNSEDIVELRKIYCKNGAYRPHEWAHMMLVLGLLQITCFAQYALCGLYWGYSINNRPELFENLFLALGIAAPVFAALYTVYSPLGRENNSDSDEESHAKSSEADANSWKKKKQQQQQHQRVMVSKPEWIGGLLDLRDDTTVCYLSFLCTCCVFGWNMERLGFGNMYVHIVTFLLLCLAPFWIFNIAALNIHNYVLGDVIGVAGVVLCVFGLMYGGFWRIQMRKRFKLPGDGFCFGSSSLTDYAKWMFCWPCSLAQEVRTGNFYDVEDDSLFRKLIESDDDVIQIVVDPPKSDDNSNPNSVSGDAMTQPIQHPPALVSIEQRDTAASST
ncbi:hypothetical protein Cni_G05399 [Canna indica]|uniref:PLAC8 family protein n=1 Tax=Canna indica TaxID=4628 RepID=A0AAQ3JX54_9LILI|nr:hypothetical protein Cni_G05399 [Canna indica]